MGLFADAQRHNVAISPGTLAELRSRAPGVAARQADPEMVAAFLSILNGPARIARTLRDLYEVGVLDAFVPEFGQLRCMVIRDLHHIYTVDEHTLRGVQILENLAEGKFRENGPLLTQVIRDIDRLEVVYLAMLLHDIGKGHGHGHSERGATQAAAVARRMGFDEDDVEMIERLVRLHLLMSHVSQHRDLQDDREIASFTREVGSVEALSRLYVMTFADMSSVAPTVWNNWRDLELGELYLRTLEVFQKGDFVPEPREHRAERIKSSLLRRSASTSRRSGSHSSGSSR